MKTRYNKSKIMRNAWFLRKIQPTMAFSVCLRKAWRNEKEIGDVGREDRGPQPRRGRCAGQNDDL